MACPSLLDTLAAPRAHDTSGGGMSIGDEVIERMRFAVDPGTSMESKNLGLLYVGKSRLEKDSFWVLEANGIDEVRASPAAA